MTFDPLIDHLWQSTIFAAAIALLSLAFRRTHAQARYWLWFAASLKFLIPFAALTAIGAQLQWRDALPQAPREWTIAFEAVSQPFAPPRVDIAFAQTPSASGLPLATLFGAIWLLGCVAILALWTLRWRRVSAAARSGSPITSGRVYDAFHCLVSPPMLPLVSSDTSLEPGVFGIIRPVLLWPRDIDARLEDGQVQAILAHELAHVRRLDNLTAVVHMLVEAIFWFHPLVWWIGGRLVDERERACDEEVIRLGSDPHVYAESILRTCQYYIESRLSCVPGVTGSDLKKRIERIMTHRQRTSLSVWNKALLATVAAMTLAAPVAVGALRDPQLPPAGKLEQATSNSSFELASVKPNRAGDDVMFSLQFQEGGRFTASGNLRMLIRTAYRLQDFQVVGGPKWMDSDRFDIVANAEGHPTPDRMRLMLRELLADRFALRLHSESREMPVFTLSMVKSDLTLGPQLSAAAVDCAALAAAARARGDTPPGPPRPGERLSCGVRFGPGTLTAGGVSIAILATNLSMWVDRIVIDRTGLRGNFDLHLEWTPELLPQPPTPLWTSDLPAIGAIDPNGPSIFTAVQEQLGLRLDAQRAPVDVIVVDSADQPREN